MNMCKSSCSYLSEKLSLCPRRASEVAICPRSHLFHGMAMTSGQPIRSPKSHRDRDDFAPRLASCYVEGLVRQKSGKQSAQRVRMSTRGPRLVPEPTGHRSRSPVSSREGRPCCQSVRNVSVGSTPNRKQGEALAGGAQFCGAGRKEHATPVSSVICRRRRRRSKRRSNRRGWGGCFAPQELLCLR